MLGAYFFADPKKRSATRDDSGKAQLIGLEPDLDKNTLRNLLIFVVVLMALNFVFGLHISIIGSLVLTIVLSLVLSRFR